MACPKIKIDWSFVLQESIIRSNYDAKKLENFKKKMEKEFLQNRQLIFQFLSKYANLSWNQKQINIWIFEGKHRSIPNPLLLNVYDYDLDFCMFEFVHMLVHNIFQDNKIYDFFEKDGQIDEIELEAFTYLITKKIAINLFLKEEVVRLIKKAEEEGFRKYIWDRVTGLEKEIDLKNESVIKILKKEYKKVKSL